jgi:transposase
MQDKKTQTEKAWKQEMLNEKAFVEKLIQQKENEIQELNDRLTFIVQELEGEDPFL